MKRIILFAASLCMLLIACQHTGKQLNSLINKKLLPSQVFKINIDRDTTLKTANGAFISIPQGALSSADGATVQLEIKEAYTIEQIVKAGLTTQSNGQPLSSGGMIYINAVAGQSVKIMKPLAIKIPTPSLDKSMQLFKGDTDRNGNVNWVKPDSLPANPQLEAFNKGKQLFMTHCASCHDVRKDGTGPALANVLARQPDKKLLYEYTRNNLRVMAAGNQYYRCLYERRNKVAMNLFPELTDQLLDTLYGYIENETKLQSLTFTKDEVKACYDSCQVYQKLKSRLEREKNKLSEQKVSMIVKDVVTPVNVNLDVDTINLPSLPSNYVRSTYNQSLYYQFKIESFGWYNIDMLLKGGFNNEESSLMVRVVGQYKESVNLYLVLPSVKVFLDGGLLKDKVDEYGFHTDDGKIILPQNTKAYILALGEAGDKIVFEKKEFMTSLQQQFDINLSVVSKEAFNASIKSLGLPDFKITAHDTQISDTLRKTIKALKDVEKIKPINCDCNCGLLIADTSINEYWDRPAK